MRSCSFCLNCLIGSSRGFFEICDFFVFWMVLFFGVAAGFLGALFFAAAGIVLGGSESESRSVKSESVPNPVRSESRSVRVVSGRVSLNFFARLSIRGLSLGSSSSSHCMVRKRKTFFCCGKERIELLLDFGGKFKKINYK